MNPAIVNNHVAVLLATHNGERWLSEQLQSLLQQNDIALSVYIADDVSSDATLETIAHVQQTAQQVNLLSTHQRFGSAAKNFFWLLQHTDFTHTHYVALSDQDDIWLPHKLKHAIDQIQAQQVDGYSSNVWAFWPNGRRKLVDKAQPQTTFDYMFESAGPGCTFVMTQRLALQLQAFLRTHAADLEAVALHDWLIYAFARSQGFRWLIDPTPTMLYRQHANNVVGANTGLKAFKARFIKLKQGWYQAQILQIARLLGYQTHPPMVRLARLNVWDRCYLALHVHHYRRRLRDRIAFLFFILWVAKQP